MDEKLRNTLRRQYYLAESLAIYDAYYRPLVKTFLPAAHRDSNENRRDDRPLTWVPLVFHCTTHCEFKKIVESGKLKCGKSRYISFTEIPLGELDRMKIRDGNQEQVAIAFPRRLLEKKGVAPVLYAKHDTNLGNLLSKLMVDNPSIKPFVELQDDVSAFQELRTTNEIDITDAIWLLTTQRDENKTPKLDHRAAFEDKYGGIPISYWHRSHQMEILGEIKYLSFQRNDNKLVGVKCHGEFYADREPFRFDVKLPKGETQIALRSVKKNSKNASEGAMYDIDVAYAIKKELESLGGNGDPLPYRQIESFPSEFGA